MSIESEIFKKAVVDFAKLEAYGFEKQADGYTLQKIFKDGDFKADVSVDKQGNVSGKVYEIATDEEFLPLRVENMGGFAGFGEHKLSKLLAEMLTKEDKDWASKSDIKWNFTKFLINKTGEVAERFEPTADMNDIEAKIVKLL